MLEAFFKNPKVQICIRCLDVAYMVVWIASFSMVAGYVLFGSAAT